MVTRPIQDVPGVVLPMRSPAPHSPPAGRSARPAAPVGRELPLAQLLDNLKSVLNGASRICVITGEAGIGKTRLLAELLDRARVHDCLVLSGKAQDYDHGIAYASLRGLLASAPAGELDEASRAVLADLLQALDAAVLGQRAGPLGHGSGLQPAYLLVTKFLSSLCRHRPVIIALDDAHLSDDETLTALLLAARHLSQLPLFLVASTRPDMWVPGTRFAATIGRLIDSGLGAVVDLGPLDPADTTALIAADLAGRPEARLAAYVYAQSRGNPLFTRHALRSLQELSAIRAEHGVCYLVGNPAAGASSRRAALLHRVFQQDRPGRELARVMSAFRRVHLDQIGALEAVTDMDRPMIEEAFDALTRAGIITSVSAGWYEFAHPLIAEVMYNDLGPLERRRLHKLIAESFGDRPLAAGIDVLEWTTHVAEAAAPGDPAAIAAVIEAARLTRDNRAAVRGDVVRARPGPAPAGGARARRAAVAPGYRAVEGLAAGGGGRGRPPGAGRAGQRRRADPDPRDGDQRHLRDGPLPRCPRHRQLAAAQRSRPGAVPGPAGTHAGPHGPSRRGRPPA